MTDSDRAIINYFLTRSMFPLRAGFEKEPMHCPYCSSSALILVELQQVADTEPGQYVIIGRFQDVTAGHEIMCLHCHRVFVVSLSGWG